jgi:hypothetical protein
MEKLAGNRDERQHHDVHKDKKTRLLHPLIAQRYQDRTICKMLEAERHRFEDNITLTLSDYLPFGPSADRLAFHIDQTAIAAPPQPTPESVFLDSAYQPSSSPIRQASVGRLPSPIRKEVRIHPSGAQ